ncbi:uncharacterized protein LOC129739513 [Uranotaenia lowii]|uniref:uncharacterized protein LOC129739513 n=1 Tax=Uranotaenia lowii TaxID=190385 RepID=UPI00247947AE|nr:uncharacterized protein LOC129739513 [Uranotaenia lowii]XP_055586963.1 uncharacterized protein LOC129739513 [Uranotaenia lowii]
MHVSALCFLLCTSAVGERYQETRNFTAFSTVSGKSFISEVRQCGHLGSAFLWVLMTSRQRGIIAVQPRFKKNLDFDHDCRSEPTRHCRSCSSERRQRRFSSEDSGGLRMLLWASGVHPQGVVPSLKVTAAGKESECAIVVVLKETVRHLSRQVAESAVLLGGSHCARQAPSGCAVEFSEPSWEQDSGIESMKRSSLLFKHRGQQSQRSNTAHRDVWVHFDPRGPIRKVE